MLRLRAFFARFASATRGAVLVYTALFAMPLIVLAGLAIDVGRMFALQRQMQNAVDALALAGAAELDRRPDSITRANAAIANLVINNHSFGTGGAQRVTVASVRFLASIPVNDGDPITNGSVTTDPFLARFVEVRATPVRLSLLFPATAFGGPSNADSGAVAVAGYSQAVCNYTPIFICNPFEVAGDPVASTRALLAASTDPLERRRLYALREPGSVYGRGNFGFLITDGRGASALREAVARVSPDLCILDRGAETRPGFINNINDAVNVRFDLWGGPFNSDRNNAAYRPALNVIKGYRTTGGGGGGGGAVCSPSASTSTEPPTWNAGAGRYESGLNSTDAQSMPRDRVMAALSGSNATRGDGNWHFAAYMDRNHWTVAGGTTPPSPVTIAGVTYSFNGINPANPPSRYDVYRWEIDNNRIPNQSGYNISTPRTVNGRTVGTRERGQPACYGGGGLSDTPDRRILYVAVINCLATPIGSGASSGALPVEAFARFFLTEPAASDKTIYGEFNGIVTPNQDGSIVRDVVRLSR